MCILARTRFNMHKELWHTKFIIRISYIIEGYKLIIWRHSFNNNNKNVMCETIYYTSGQNRVTGLDRQLQQLVHLVSIFFSIFQSNDSSTLSISSRKILLSSYSQVCEISQSWKSRRENLINHLLNLSVYSLHQWCSCIRTMYILI